MDSKVDNVEIIFEAEPAESNIINIMNDEFPEGEVVASHSFGGTALATLIITASITAVRLIFKFYKEYKTSLKNAKLKIGKGQISLEGFSANEINEMAKNGTLQNLMDKIK